MCTKMGELTTIGNLLQEWLKACIKRVNVEFKENKTA